MRLGIGVGGLAGRGELHHVLRDEEDVVLEQCGSALRSPRPVRSRWRSAAIAPMAPNMPPMMSFTLVPARSGSPERPGHVGEAAHHLHHFVERGAVVVRAGQEALVADVDEARVQLRRLS